MPRFRNFRFVDKLITFSKQFVVSVRKLKLWSSALWKEATVNKTVYDDNSKGNVRLINDCLMLFFILHWFCRATLIW